MTLFAVILNSYSFYLGWRISIANKEERKVFTGLALAIQGGALFIIRHQLLVNKHHLSARGQRLPHYCARAKNCRVKAHP